MKKGIIIIIGAIFLILGLGYIKETFKDQSFSPKYESVEANVTDYFVYGSYLSIYGQIKKLDLKEINKVELVLQTETDEISYPLNYSYTKKHLGFQTSDKINQGVDLENIKHGNYFASLKITSKDNEFYYPLINKTKEPSMDYYTITKKQENNLVRFTFNEIYKNDNVYRFASIQSETVKLPTNLYDFVIDASHGGDDIGVAKETKNEKDITLDFSNKLKEALEAKGYKVLLTRTDDTNIPNYGRGGRYSVSYQTKAKYFLSIALTSNPDDQVKGVEVNVPNNFDLSRSIDLINNLKEKNISISNSDQSRLKEGIYQTYYTEEKMQQELDFAKEKNYKPYKIEKNTVTEEALRETGGRMTHAFFDGRYPEAGNNPYYHSNSAAESYLIKLGFVSNDAEMNALTERQSDYIDAIVKTFEK